MSADEIATVTQQYRRRITTLLSSAEVAQLATYEQRLQDQIDARASAPIAPTAGEQVILDKIAADAQAAALHKQLMVLLRIETLPQ